MTDADDREAFLQARCGSLGASKIREALSRLKRGGERTKAMTPAKKRPRRRGGPTGISPWEEPGEGHGGCGVGRIIAGGSPSRRALNILSASSGKMQWLDFSIILWVSLTTFAH